MKQHREQTKRHDGKHRPGKEKRKEQNKIHKGIIRTTGRGAGFVAVEGFEKDIAIEPSFLNTALNGDEVEVIITGRHFAVKRGRPYENARAAQADTTQMAGQVVRIIRRARKQFVGLLAQKEGHWWVMPDDRKVYVNILIPSVPRADEQGKKVLARIVRWEKNESFPTGEVISVLGEKGDHETEIQSIILDRGIDTHFPDDVMREAEKIGKTSRELDSTELAKRRDFRETVTFTIDPIDAKDFDDALSVKDLGNGTYEIGVHIADVSHYVREHTALDREAARRAFSVYLVDRTIPMLPEVLSNDLCSLNPHEDRYAFSAVFTIDTNGKVHSRWFGKTAINSNKRFTYENAQETLDKKSGEFYKELSVLNDIGKKLQAVKYGQGAIDFEQQEVKFKLDERGRPIEVYKKERLDTHKLVEEFMLLANREVAEFIYKQQKGKLNKASIYRIHDIPDSERIEELSLFIQALGYHLPVKQGRVTSRDINRLLKSIEGKPEESLIKTASIRSMAKAIYSTRNIGHFGLAFKYYTHFTSPIRRYPDLIVHRILNSILEKNPVQIKDEIRHFEKIATHSTDQEIAAAEAERASIKYKQVEYMSERVGQEFDGIISGVTEWGIYIEEKNTKCEGMVALRDLRDDYYVFNRKTYSVQGEKTKKKFRLGDSVRFRVANADLDAKTLDYALV